MQARKFKSKNVTERTQQQILFIQSAEKFKGEFARILNRIYNLKLGDFRFYFSPKPSVRAEFGEGEIYFKTTIPKETIKQIEQMLRELGISVSFYDMSWRSKHRGIQLWSNLGEMQQKLSQFAGSLDKQIGSQHKLDISKEIKQSAALKQPYLKQTIAVDSSFDKVHTKLMVAVKGENVELAKYLLQHSANPNAEMSLGMDEETPLSLAIKSKNPAMIKLLVKAGAIVTHDVVNNAIEENVNFLSIVFLIHSCIDQEDPFEPYLMSAITSGQVALLLNLLKTQALVKKFKDIAEFGEKPLEKRILLAAAESGSIDMMKYVVSELHCNLEKSLAEDYRLCKSLNDKSLDDVAWNTILFRAAFGGTNMLRYILANQKIQPSQEIIEKLKKLGTFRVKETREIQTYLQSLLTPRASSTPTVSENPATKFIFGKDADTLFKSKKSADDKSDDGAMDIEKNPGPF